MKKIDALKAKIFNGEVLDVLVDRKISVHLASSILNVAALAVDDEAFDDTIACSMIDSVMRNDALTIYTPLLIDSLYNMMDVPSSSPESLCKTYFGFDTCPARLGFGKFIEELTYFPDKRIGLLLGCAKKYPSCFADRRAFSLFIQKIYTGDALPKAYVLSSLAAGIGPARHSKGPIVIPLGFLQHIMFDSSETGVMPDEDDDSTEVPEAESGHSGTQFDSLPLFEMLVGAYCDISENADEFEDRMTEFLNMSKPAFNKFVAHRVEKPNESKEELFDYVVKEILPIIAKDNDH